MSHIQNITQLENAIIHQAQAEDEQSFLYQLHELSFFDKSTFNQLLNNCQALAKAYQQLGKTNNYNEVVKGILLIFEYTLFSFYCHHAEHDYFHISNYGDELTTNDISDYYDKIRLITQQIIL
ncbi:MULTISPECIES: Imm41 family immunity protein [unclassified Gilliamella]|jgi:hypothetical protein|uniref:Imm41 family immunity protein n=2 Tax=Gilliamella TaxID=1193503 RepID=UPI00080E68B3|nr:Imm41 family immunity protein [Gilliamella apicola]OCG26450.1 hypothetical protein A9G46_04860 [Gilliamella apicola]OCG30698.1 hypothetical protein A9G45_02245 [Gilliamella apicola]OCG56929.1 hypothetical protein A9G30_01950 [Gilliamella apicola]OCG58085.1 hypothetical protein A9G40_10950 [Gilliamella apicola]OCG67581.1 hypothetical protein A9G41_09715 [Gilliamella apicola]